MKVSPIREVEKEANAAMIWKSMVAEVYRTGPPAPSDPDPKPDFTRMKQHARRIHAADSSWNRLVAKEKL